MTQRTILIVEDELIVQMHLSGIVSGLGHRVSGTATSGAEALAAADAMAPDLVLMDIRLANGDDGVETAQQLRDLHGCAVIFVTAYADMETIARTSHVLPAGYVVKPFTGAEVHAAITTALGTLAQQQQMEAQVAVQASAQAEAQASLQASAQADAARDAHGGVAMDHEPDRASHARSFGESTRLLVYSHDTFGLGHLRRSLKLIRALTTVHPALSTLLVTGSPMVHQYQMPAGTDYLKLPAVRKVAPTAYEARSLTMSGENIQRMRSNLLLRTIRDYDPDVLLVDHSPLGMNGELLPALRWLKEKGRAVRLLGLRDIIDAPETVVPQWTESGVYDDLQRYYDHVLIYGNRAVYDTVGNYGFPEELAERTRFLNYVSHLLPGERAQEASVDGGAALVPHDGRPLVAVSIGGGDGGADSVIGPFLDMLARFKERISFTTEILTGPFISADREQHFRDQARDLPVNLTSFVPAPTTIYAQADLVVATAGYNTTTELLACARRAIFIPRVMHRQEQLIRARRMDELGLARCLHPDDVTPERLLEEIERALADPREPLTEGRARGLVPLDGAEHFAAFCGSLLVGATE